jgi:sortase A
VLLPVLVPASLVACSSDDGGSTSGPGVAELPSETADDPMFASPATTAAAATTVSRATTTTVAPTTVAPTTELPTTAAPTVVETLPQPAAPPDPRADEPYTELGTLEIPKLGISQPLLEGVSLTTLDRGPGHWPGTAMPGHVGNVVIAGHRTSHGKVFRHIDQLAAGDEVVLTTGEGQFVYVVTEVTVVQPDALYIIEQTPDRTATLFACHPPGSTRQRIVAHLALQSEPAAG